MFVRRVTEFAAVVGFIKGAAVIIPGFDITWVGAAVFSVILAVVSGAMEWLAGSMLSPRAHAVRAWVEVVAMLYIAPYFLPGMHITGFAALLAGTVVWLAGLVMPRLWG